MKKNIELLSPAGTMESVKAAVNAGANAVYIGGKSFNARNAAGNFTDDEIEEVVDYCKIRDVKVFLTVNTLCKNKELEELFAFLDRQYEYGVDAFIVQDIGVATEIKKRYPDVQLHGSTQMSVHNLEGVKYLEKLGFDRVVLARELSLEEIKYISQNTDLDLEVFIHGALCVSYSGQCLMSSLIGGRSGNRGRCAQSCRMTYSLIDKDENTIESGYLLSPKDVMTLEILDEICDTGIVSLKIEGRMKSPEYVYQITKAYREKLDDKLINYEETIKDVTQIFNRGGSFTSGYFENYAGLSMMSTETPKSTGRFLGKVLSYDEKLEKCKIRLSDKVIPGDGIEIWTQEVPHVGTNISVEAEAGEMITVILQGNIKKNDLVFKSFDKDLKDRLKSTYKKDLGKMVVNCDVSCKMGQPLKIKMYVKNMEVEVEGNIVEKAENNPTTEATILKKINKTGDTPFTLNFCNVEIEDNLFVNLTKLNDLKRDALTALEIKLAASFKREPVKNIIELKTPSVYSGDKKIIVQIENGKKIDEVIKNKPYAIYFELGSDFMSNMDKYINICNENNIPLYVSLPPITQGENQENLKEIMSVLNKTSIQGFVVKNFGQIEFVGNGKETVIDYNFNIINTLSYQHFTSISKNITLSPEMNITEINEIADEESQIIIHGFMPVMTTKQCPVGLFLDKKDEGRFCKYKNNNEKYYLKDRKDIKFRVRTNCDLCNATIFNGQDLFMLDKYKDLMKTNVQYFRLVLTEEPNYSDIIAAYKRAIEEENETDIEYTKNSILNLGLTHGHYYRGVL